MKETTQSEYEKAINKVVDYISLHLYSVPTTRELSAIANISAFHLHRIFKSIIGENIGEFICRLRLEDIALRLLMTNTTLTDIALETGYGTKHALSRAFKNHFGVSPSVYRLRPKDLHPFFGDEERREMTFNPEIRIVGSKTVVYIRIIDRYGAEKSFREGWAKLSKFAKANNLVDNNTEYIGLSFDDPAITNPEKCRFYACFTPNREVKAADVFGVRNIPGGRYAVFLHKGAYHNLTDTYYNIYVRWLPRSSFKARGSLSFEKYLNSPRYVSEDELLTEIYVPIWQKKN